MSERSPADVLAEGQRLELPQLHKPDCEICVAFIERSREHIRSCSVCSARREPNTYPALVCRAYSELVKEMGDHRLAENPS